MCSTTWTFEPEIKVLLEEIKRDGHPLTKASHFKQKHSSKDHSKENKKYIHDLQREVKQSRSLCSKQANLIRSSVCHQKKCTDEQLPRLKPSSAGTRLNGDQSVKDLVDHFTCSACHMKEVKPKLVTPHPLGHIPSYVTRRKKLLEEAARIVEEESKKPYVPPDHRFVTEEERLEILDLLKQIQEELMLSFARLPLVIETMRAKNCKEDLERRLSKVEEGIAFFSNPKVLMKDDT